MSHWPRLSLIHGIDCNSKENKVSNIRLEMNSKFYYEITFYHLLSQTNIFSCFNFTMTDIDINIHHRCYFFVEIAVVESSSRIRGNSFNDLIMIQYTASIFYVHAIF